MNSEKQAVAQLIERSRRAIDQARQIRKEAREIRAQGRESGFSSPPQEGKSVSESEDKKTKAKQNGSAQALLSEFASDVAHEVRQPLSAIMCNADAALILIDAGRPPLDEIRTILNDIRSADIRANG